MKRRIILLTFAALFAGMARAAIPDSISGTIRVSGSEQMEVLLSKWEKGFRRLHPNVRFERWLKGTGSAIYSRG